MAHERERAALARFLGEHSLKHTRQRDIILEAFLSGGGHVTSEDLYQSVRRSHPQIGYTTIYRTMKLLADAGLAKERHFDDGVTRYEVESDHHDHLVCTGCGRIVEFECDEIEARQEQVAREHEFELTHHRLELYGRCRECCAEAMSESK